MALGAVLVAAAARGQGLVPPPPPEPYAQEYTELNIDSSGAGFVASRYSVFHVARDAQVWTPIIEGTEGEYGSIRAIQFVDDSTLFVYTDKGLYGGDLWDLPLRTTDVPSLRHPQARDIVRPGFFFLDADNGFALGTGQLLRTTDGGRSWSQRVMPSPLGDEPLRLEMFDMQRGVAFAQRGPIVTSDGGKSWHAPMPRPPIDDGRCLRNGACVGWKAGNIAKAYFTTDYGETWRETDTGLEEGKDSVHGYEILSADFAAIVGSRAALSMAERSTTIGGETVVRASRRSGLIAHWDGTRWATREVPEVEKFFAIHYATRTDAWASADTNGILHSTDGGQTWKFISDYYRRQH